ncbi:MAG: sulfatase family protein [Anaerolineae bacterium]
MPRQPNVLWIMTDQQRADALGAVTPWMHTPNLDRLAVEGVHLRRAFAQSPVCVPSRINYVTGRYPHSHRNRENNARVGPGEPHIFRVLKASGYNLGIIGKNHMFYEDELVNLNLDLTHVDKMGDNSSPEAQAYQAHWAECRRRLWEEGSWTASFHDFPEELTRTHRTGAAAVDYLRQADPSRPFFLWVSFADPHVPHTAPRRFAHLYPLEEMPVPPGALASEAEAEVRDKPRRQAIKRKAQGMVGAPEEGLRRYLAVYSAMISFIDEWIGRILYTLAMRGLAEDTIVVFVSDHGDFRGEHGMVKKDLLLYDALLNVPCIIRHPGHIKPQVVDALVEQVDLYPTLMDYLRLELPKGVQGRSLRPLLEGDVDAIHGAVFGEICPPLYRNPYASADGFISEWEKYHAAEGHPLQWTAPYNVPGDYIKSIRTSTRKYVWYANGEEELYDLEADPGETVNLAGDPAYADEKRILKMHLLEWHALSEDPLDSGDARAFAQRYPWATGR